MFEQIIIEQILEQIIIEQLFEQIIIEQLFETIIDQIFGPSKIIMLISADRENYNYNFGPIIIIIIIFPGLAGSILAKFSSYIGACSNTISATINMSVS